MCPIAPEELSMLKEKCASTKSFEYCVSVLCALGSVIDKKVESLQSIVDKIWNLTNEVHLTHTEWKPFPCIYPICTTVVGRASIIAN
jgi:hypothetical protein